MNYEYDAWGNLLNTPQTVLTGNGDSLADANPFRYCGYQFDKETGFYYLKYRYYIPSLGRFLTRDPMMTGNRYVYCRNNPVNFVDPLGLLRIVDDYVVELPNKKIIDTRTGKTKKKDTLKGLEYSIGGSKDIVGGKVALQYVRNKEKEVLLFYVAAGIDIVNFGAQSALAYVEYYSEDPSVVKGFSGEIGGNVNLPFGTVGGAELFSLSNLQKVEPIGHSFSIGPAAKLPGVASHVFVVGTVISQVFDIYEPSHYLERYLHY